LIVQLTKKTSVGRMSLQVGVFLHCY